MTTLFLGILIPSVTSSLAFFVRGMRKADCHVWRGGNRIIINKLWYCRPSAGFDIESNGEMVSALFGAYVWRILGVAGSLIM